MKQWHIQREALRRHAAALLLGLGLGAVALALVVYAVAWHGYAAEQTSLNDGGVWVTDTHQGLIGRENTPLRQLDVEVQSPTRPGDRLDVLQNGEAVVAVDDDASEVTPVDASLAVANPHDAVPVKDPDVQLGGDVVALTDPAGQIWGTHVDPSAGAGSLAGLAYSSKPLAKIGAGAVLTVSDQGTIYAASSATRTLTKLESDTGQFSRARSSLLNPAPTGTVAQMTTVGEEPVWLDSNGHVGFAGHMVEVGKGAQLQQPGPAASSVLVDTPSSLLSISLATARVRTLTTLPALQADAPVELEGCSWGLWTGQTSATVAVKCPGTKLRLTPFAVPEGADLVFRVNRSSIFVNDIVSGDVWAVNGADVQLVANWQALAPQQVQKQQSQEQVANPTNQSPPRAVTDVLGGRSGDTTVLHVLDNDRAPAGAILAINAVENNNKQINVQIAPDRQTLLAQVDQGVTDQRFVFHYTIADGERTNDTATGEVDFTVHAADPSHAQPQLRYGYALQPAPVYPVAAGGSVQVPVLPEWRDATYGDPIEVVAGSVTASKGTASVTPEGLLRYVAPPNYSGTVTLGYSVTTGGAQNHGQVRVKVYNGLATAAPVAEPNVVSAVAGSPVTVTPLENAIPGADPVDANAQLALAAPVAPQPGLDVASNLDAGTVTVNASRPGTYLLPYRISYGSAAAASSSDIELIAKPASSVSNLPVATPVTTAVYGASPATVDVLASDYDPRGRLLAVIGASPQNQDGQLNVSVIDGRWLRVSSRSGSLNPGTQVIDYTISNGDAQASSTLTVTQLPAIPAAEDGPDAQPVQAIVRAGESVDIPVLQNDSTPSGDPIALVTEQTQTPGTLPVSSGPGSAYVDGNAVRFVAPSNVSEPTTSSFVYAVANASNSAAPQASALVTVKIIPAPSKSRPDEAPTPPELDARVVSGGTVTLQLPPVGDDPQGDQLTVTGIGDPSVAGSEPRLGQVVAYGADTITYQAFVGQYGEDQFTYRVSDPYGQTADGTVRVVIAPPGSEEPPVAVDRTVTVDPRNTLRVDVLSNDLFPAGTTPEMEPLRYAPAGVTARNGVITVKPGSYGTQLVVPYTATNGLAQSSANLIVNFQPGYENPPLAGDVIAKVQPGHDSVVANVLKQVTDIDEPDSDLRLVSVDGAPSSDIHGGTVTLPLSKDPRVWTYHVRNAAGAEAAGSIYVSGSTAQLPYLKAGSVLHIPVGGTATVQLPDYVVTPVKGTQPYLTLVKDISGEPTSAFAQPVGAAGQQALTVHAGHTAGTAEVTFQVSDKANLSAKGAHTALLTLPVVIGSPEPVLTCPNVPITVPESGSQTLDVGAVCHVWQNPYDPKHLTYSGSLAAPLSGISIRNNGALMQIDAVHATAGDVGAIDLHVNGYPATAKLDLTVTPLPPPSMRPIPQLQAQAGKPISLNLAPYLQNDSLPASAFDPAVISVRPLDGGPAAQTSGGTTVTFTPPSGEHKTFNYQVVMSDSGAHPASASRTATQSLSIVVTTVPGVVTGLAAGSQVLSDKVELQWSAPDAGGLQITRYVVTDQAGQTTCLTTTCTIGGLQNGTHYSFRVTAYNALGASPRPSTAVTATPDAVPSAVTNLQVTQEGDGVITYQWDRPTGDFSAVTEYLVSGGGSSGYQTLPSTAAVVTDVVHAANGSPVDFSVSPVNALGVDKAGQAVPDNSGVASGAPSAPGAPTIQGTNVAGGATKAFSLAWNQVSPNGRGQDTYYEVLVDGQPATCVGEAQWFTATNCTVDVPNTGTSYTYTVVAANEAGVPGLNQSSIEGAASTHQSPPSAGASAIAAGEPSSITATLVPNGQTGQATLTLTAGASNGASGTVTCVDSTITCSFDVGSSGATKTDTVTGLTDGQAYSVALQYCNGATANTTLGVTPCITSSTVSATPYGPIGTPTLTASANGPAITLTGAVDANGGNVNVKITDTTDGQSHDCGVEGPSGTVPCDWTETGLSYQKTYNYTISATDATSDGRAAVSTPASALTPNPPAISGANLSGTVNGTSISVSGSANGNGLPITVTITSNGGGSNTCTGSGLVPCSVNASNLSNSTSYTYTLTATDASGYGREAGTATWSGTTVAPPSPPSVSVSKGTAAPTSKCGGAPSCYYIQTTTANFSGTVTCHITASTYGLAGFITWQQGANAGQNGPDAQENQSVTVQCTDGSQTASGTGSW